jgi:hypothetical protein
MKMEFAPDSPLEEEGFELLVPPSNRTTVRRARPRFLTPDCTGCDRLTKEKNDFELPASQSNLAG